MGSFPSSFGYEYLSSRIEVITMKNCDHKVVMKVLKSRIFSRFECPRTNISDNEAHFINAQVKALSKRNGVNIKCLPHITLKPMVK